MGGQARRTPKLYRAARSQPAGRLLWVLQSLPLVGCRPLDACLGAVEGPLLTSLPTRAYGLGGLSSQPAGWSRHALREQIPIIALIDG